MTEEIEKVYVAEAQIEGRDVSMEVYAGINTAKKEFPIKVTNEEEVCVNWSKIHYGPAFWSAGYENIYLTITEKELR